MLGNVRVCVRCVREHACALACVCVRARVHACVRVCMRVCVRACVGGWVAITSRSLLTNGNIVSQSLRRSS